MVAELQLSGLASLSLSCARMIQAHTEASQLLLGTEERLVFASPGNSCLHAFCKPGGFYKLGVSVGCVLIVRTLLFGDSHLES